MTTIDKQNKESLEEKISKLAETLAGIQERAVIEYLKTKDYVFENKIIKDLGFDKNSDTVKDLCSKGYIISNAFFSFM